MPTLADLARAGPGLLGYILDASNSLQRNVKNSVRGLLDSPQDFVSMRLAQLAEGLPQLQPSVMPGVDQVGLGPQQPSAMDWGTNMALNAPTIGLLGTTKPIPSYGISHRPMADAGGAARAHDLVPAFGEDVYGPNALQYFGSGDARESSVLRILKKIRGNPDAEVTIYRGVPKDGTKAINHGDWVTLDPRVAADYGNVVKKTVKASDITSWPDSLLEFGYFPKSE